MSDADAQKLLVAALSALLSTIATILITKNETIRKAVKQNVENEASIMVQPTQNQDELSKASLKIIATALDIIAKQDGELDELRDQLSNVEKLLEERREKTGHAKIQL